MRKRIITAELAILFLIGLFSGCGKAMDTVGNASTAPMAPAKGEAYYDYDMPMEDALKTISPMHRIGDMRKIPYFLVNCCDDEVFPEAQLDEYVDKLRERGHDVIYRKMPGKKHGEFIPEIKSEFYDFLYSSVKNV